MTPRPYQIEGHAAVLEAFRSFHSALVVWPTGMGKTVLFSGLARDWPTGRVMVTAHREELVFQAARKIEAATGEKPAIEMADRRSDETNLWNPARVVVASVQTLCRSTRLAKFRPADFGLLIVDEAHHDVPQCSTYQAIRRHFGANPALKILGVTATPDRADKLALRQTYETVAHQLELPDAIDAGWLVPIRQRFCVVTGLDFSHVRVTAGDYNAGDLERAMADEPEVCHQVASTIASAAAGRKTLVFCVSVDHARITTDILNRIPGVGRAACLTGEDDDDTRQRVLKEYAAGRVNVLVGCAIFTEGFDEPSIEVVAVARPTASRALYTQMVGRGTRTLDGTLTANLNAAEAVARRAVIAASRKPHLEVIDFVGNSGKLPLVNTGDILAGRVAPAARVKATAEAIRGGGSVDLRKAAEEAEDQRKRAEERQAAVRRQREQDEQRRRGVYGRAGYEMQEVDPFGPGATGDRGGFRARKLPSERMIGLLRKHGLYRDGMTFGEAAAAISTLKASWEGRSCSPKQKAVLEKHGERGAIGREKARVLFALLHARRWRPRDYPLTRDRLSIRKLEDGRFAPVVTDPVAGKVLVVDATFGTVDDCRAFLGAVVEQGQAA